MTDFKTERDEAVKKMQAGEHGCFTGDCPHLNHSECYVAISTYSADWALSSQLVKQMAEASAAVLRFQDYKPGDKTLCDQLHEALAAYHEACKEMK